MEHRYYKYFFILSSICCIIPFLLQKQTFNTFLSTVITESAGNENINVNVNTEHNQGGRHIGKEMHPERETASSALKKRTFVSRIWQSADDQGYFYVYSAYVDDLEWKIRVMGIGKRLNTKVSIHCHIWKTSEDKQPETVDGDTWYLSDSVKPSYCPVIMSCPVINGSRPFAVSVMVNNSQTTRNIIKITYPSKNKTDITVCFPALHSNYKKTDNIISFFEINKLLGAQRFVIYNYSASPEVSFILNEYVKEGILEVVQWDIPVKDIHYFGQIAMINDCLYRNLHVSNYLVYCDLDEILLPRKDKNWMALIKSVLKREPSVGSILFRNTFFVTNAEWKIDNERYNQSKEARKYNLTPLLRVWRDNYIFPPNKRSKQLVIADRVRAVTVHFVHRNMYRNKFKVHVLSPEEGLLHHYRWMSGVKERVKDDFIRKYSNVLISSIKRRYSSLKTAKMKNKLK